MTAKLATVHDRILAHIEKAAAVHDINIHQYGSSDKQRVGSLQFGCEYLSPYFVTDPDRMEIVFDDAYVLIHKKRISSKNDLISILEQVTKSGKPLHIISEDVGGEALATLVVNKLRGPLRVAAIRAARVGNQRKRMLQDIARVTGGKAITEDLDIPMRNIGQTDILFLLFLLKATECACRGRSQRIVSKTVPSRSFQMVENTGFSTTNAEYVHCRRLPDILREQKAISAYGRGGQCALKPGGF